MLSYKRIRDLHLCSHLLELLKSLLKLFTRRRILSTGCNELHRVELGLVVEIVQELDDLIELI